MALGQIITVTLLLLVAVAVLVFHLRTSGYIWGALWEAVAPDLRSSDPIARGRARMALAFTVIVFIVASVAGIILGSCYIK